MDTAPAAREPNGLDAIRAARQPGPCRLRKTFDEEAHVERLEGALLGRMAGCTLGAPVELWPIAEMAALAAENGDRFPPTDYWRSVPEPDRKRYDVSPRRSYNQERFSIRNVLRRFGQLARRTLGAGVSDLPETSVGNLRTAKGI